MSRHPKYPERCERLLAEYDVRHLVHFTPVANLKNIFLEGLLPSTGGEGDDAVCMSILKPYMKMFHSKRTNYRKNDYFVFLIIQTDVIIDKLCGFFPESAISKNMQWNGRSARNRTKFWDLKKVFCEQDTDWGFEASAEIQVLETVEPEYIQGIVPEYDMPTYKIKSLMERYPDDVFYTWPEDWNNIR